MSFTIVLAGGPFDGIEHELEAPRRFVEVRRECSNPDHSLGPARYYPTSDTDRGGRLIYAYEAP